MSGDFNDYDPLYDDPLRARDAELEARFQALEREDEIDALRARIAREGAYGETPPRNTRREADPSPGRGAREVSGEERFVLLLCSHCGGKNRTSLARLQRNQLPRCGRCRSELYYTR